MEDNGKSTMRIDRMLWPAADWVPECLGDPGNLDQHLSFARCFISRYLKNLYFVTSMTSHIDRNSFLTDVPRKVVELIPHLNTKTNTWLFGIFTGVQFCYRDLN